VTSKVDVFAATVGGLLGLGAALFAVRLDAPPVLGVAVGAVVAGVTYALMGRQARARRRLEASALPGTFAEILEREVGFYRALEPPERARFEREVGVFLGEHSVTGPRGASLPDDLRVLVAASAVIVVFGRPDFRYPVLRDVVVYPSSFDPDEWQPKEDGEFDGQVLDQGPVLLSAEALREGFRGDVPGGNVGIHEFAHLLDMERGESTGVPSIMPEDVVAPWLELMKRESERAATGKSMLDEYAATHESEFFAVATEAFFERPRAMKRRHPDLYDLLARTYRQDPASRPVQRRRAQPHSDGGGEQPGGD
jgi:Mlc titration factor MtfA (ptsG expression regulator)